MNRRQFAQALTASARAAQKKQIEVALLTNAAGPHLPNYLEGHAKTDEISHVYLSDPDSRVEASARQVLGAKLGGSSCSPGSCSPARLASPMAWTRRSSRTRRGSPRVSQDVGRGKVPCGRWPSDLAWHTLAGPRDVRLRHPIRELAAFAANVGGAPIDTEDSAVVAVRFDNGVLVTLTSGYHLGCVYRSLLKIWGSAGWASRQRHTYKPPLERYRRGQLRQYQGPTEPAEYTPLAGTVARAAAGLDRRLLGPQDSLHVLKTVLAAYRAAESGTLVCSPKISLFLSACPRAS